MDNKNTQNKNLKLSQTKTIKLTCGVRKNVLDTGAWNDNSPQPNIYPARVQTVYMLLDNIAAAPPHLWKTSMKTLFI